MSENSFSLLDHPNKLVWLVFICVVTVSIWLEVTQSWACENNVFQRSGALLVALLIPFYGYLLSNLADYRAFGYAENARIEAKKLFSYLLQSNGIDENSADKALKLGGHIEDAAASRSLINVLSRYTMRSNIAVLVFATLIWGFGDLFSQRFLQC